jgi:hypothetical protein
MDPFTNCDQQVTSSQLANAIEGAFCQYALQIINSGVDGAKLHRTVLVRFKEAWKEMRSNRDCLACLASAPENTLQCHHSICAPCTMAYGIACSGEPWTFWVELCPLCAEPNQKKFVHKPDTAGVRAVIAEGGGVRGIVPLSFLKELETAIDLPMEIREHFDIAFGSSSGRLIWLLLRVSADHGRRSGYPGALLKQMDCGKLLETISTFIYISLSEKSAAPVTFHLRHA